MKRMADSPLVARVTEEYFARFGEPPVAVVWGPGRVNLIGEHTDYNGGFVLPMAIDRGIAIALAPADSDEVTVKALDFADEREFHCDELTLENREPRLAGWIDYLCGTAWALRESGLTLRGWRGVMAGDLPIGAGLSSSAALEMATARAFCFTSELKWDPHAMALAGQLGENRWVGVNCGIMDQMACAAGREAHALLLDCRSLDIEAVPLPPDSAVVVLDSGTRRGLVDSAYNERRQQCESAARHFRVTTLREVSRKQLGHQRATLDPVVARRAHHVISEIERTRKAATAMQNADSATLGLLMNESHTSLRDDFEVSTPALDALVECARLEPGCRGARMTGAGFGGCAVALVDAAVVEQFTRAICTAYRTATGHSALAYTCLPSDGARIL